MNNYYVVYSIPNLGFKAGGWTDFNGTFEETESICIELNALNNGKNYYSKHALESCGRYECRCPNGECATYGLKPRDYDPTDPDASRWRTEQKLVKLRQQLKDLDDQRAKIMDEIAHVM
jgi:hypothetical protein